MSNDTKAPVAVIGQLELVKAAGSRFAQVEKLLAEKGIVVVYPKDAPKPPPEPEKPEVGIPENPDEKPSEPTKPGEPDKPVEPAAE